MNHVRSIASLAYAFVLFTGTAQAATMVRGNIKKDDAKKTFSFPIKTCAITQNGSQIIVGSALEKQAQYALSSLASVRNACTPLVKQKCKNGLSKQISNPLFSQAIKSIDVAHGFGGRGDCLVVTTQNNAERLYLVDNVTSGEKRVYEKNIVDAGGVELNGGIVGVGSAPVLSFNHPVYGFGKAGVVFAAVKGHGADTFGDGASGIAAVCLVETNREELQTVKKDTAQTQASEGAADQEEQKELRKLKEWSFDALNLSPSTSVFPLNKSSDVIKIGHDLAGMGDVVALHWHEKLNCLYVGLQVKAGGDQHDGACALLVGTIGAQGLELKPVVSVSTFKSGACNEIVGAIGAHATASIYDIQSMRTQMLLDYLIITGGNGSPQDARRTIYALPIVSDPKMSEKDVRIDSQALGRLAAKKNTIKDSYELVQYGFKRWYHSFDRVAMQADDLFTADDTPENAPARVGCGPVPHGEIIQTIVNGDAVIAVVKSDDKLRPSGMFVSQAIFSRDRNIAGWTKWHPIATTYDDLVGASCNAATGTVSLVANCADGQGALINRTQWHKGIGPDQGLDCVAEQVNSLFTPEEGGVHGLFTFHMPQKEQAALVVTGLKKIMLAIHEYRNTTFEPEPLQVCAIEGGVLNEIGAITAATLCTDRRLMFIGGVDGIAISDDSLWNKLDAYGDGIGDYFVRVGDYRFVKKLMYDNGYLYVLTDKMLDRIDVRASSFATNQLVRVRLASVNQLDGFTQYSSFNDCIVSEKMALLATSHGLLRVGNGENIADPQLRDAQLSWQEVELEGDIKGVVRLTAISATGKEEDVARYCGGHVYAIAGYIGKDRARINRLYVSSTTNAPINDDAVARLPGYLGKKIGDAYASFKSFRDIFMTDGILNISARYQNDDTGPLSLTNGFHKENIIMVPDAESASRIVGVRRDPLTGSLLVAGDFGIRILE